MKYKTAPEKKLHDCVGCVNAEYKMKPCLDFICDMENQGLPDCTYADLIYVIKGQFVQQPDFLYDNLGERIETN